MSKQQAEPTEQAEKAPPHVYEINGREVVFKQRYPLKENRDLLAAWHAHNISDVTTFYGLWSQMIESWGFEGDPKDKASYDALDVVSELNPLVSVTLRFWNQRFNIVPKN